MEDQVKPAQQSFWAKQWAVPRVWVYAPLTVIVLASAGLTAAKVQYYNAVEHQALEPRAYTMVDAPEPTANVEEPVVEAEPEPTPEPKPEPAATTSAPQTTAPTTTTTTTDNPPTTTATTETTTAAPTIDLTAPPTLSHLGVDFGRYNSTDGTAGAFRFVADLDWAFIGFGDVVMGSNGPKSLPTFEYRLSESATVYAATSGYITKADFRSDSQDYTINISADLVGKSTWWVEHDHVRNLKVSVGDYVTAGQGLGNPGSSNVAGIGRTELMLIESGSTAIAHCPFNYYDTRVLASHQQLIREFVADWEFYKGDTSIYNESLYPTYFGCRSNSMEG